MVKFTDKIPLPEVAPTSEVGKALLQIKAGQSFSVKREEERRSALTTAKRLGVKVTSRKVDGKGYRIWRVS